jgi:hypothetical protein
VQAELAKISLLKAEILRMQLAFKELSSLTIHSIMSSLHEWYSQLPAPLRVDWSGRDTLSPQVRWSIAHIQLLYLGAIMLLYRRIATQFVCSQDLGPDRSLLGEPQEDLVRRHGEDAVEAAAMSSRTLGLLHGDEGIFKRCWLVM